eukprot:5768775-Pleurochrysis_carterae.AAC.1
MSAFTAAAAAAACATRPGWWNASTVSNSHSDLTSTPPSPAWETMSWSPQASVSAAAQSASRLICLVPANRVVRSDRRTGRQSIGSAQSHTIPRAHRGISSCDTVTVGTLGTCTSSPPARARSAATAASAVRNQRRPRPAGARPPHPAPAAARCLSAALGALAPRAACPAAVPAGTPPAPPAWVPSRAGQPASAPGCEERQTPVAWRARRRSARVRTRRAGGHPRCGRRRQRPPSQRARTRAGCRRTPLPLAGPPERRSSAVGRRLPPARATRRSRLAHAPPRHGRPRRACTVPRVAGPRARELGAPRRPATCIAGNTQSGAWDAKRGHQATPPGSPQSAGFSTAHTAPAPSAAVTSAAVNWASALCLARYRVQRRGTGVTPSGSERERSCGTWATEKDAHGGAANTTW